MTYTPDQLQRISPRFATPDYIERGVKQVLELPVYLEASLVAPTAGTLEIYSSTNGNTTPLLGPYVCSVVGDKAWYELPVADTEDLDLADDWMEVWTLTIDGDPYEFRREAALVRCRLRPVISDIDLERMHSELKEWRYEGRSSYQDYRDAAWDEIQTHLMEQGNRPYLILSSYALRTVHLDLTLAMIFLDYASSAAGTSTGKYGEIAEAYRTKFEKDFKKLHFRYDSEEDGMPGDSKRNVSPVIMLTRPAYWTRSTGGEPV